MNTDYLCRRLDGPAIKSSACIGLDGFVDRILWVVNKRTDSEHFDRVNTLYDYGKEIMDAAGLSLNVEMVPISIKYGGNGPIMASAIAGLGVETSCLGAFGEEKIRPVFKDMRNVRLYSFAEPANTDAIEFLDGKLITSVLDSLNKITWDSIKKVLGVQMICSLFDGADLIAMNNWTMLPAMSEIWKRMREEVFPYLSKGTTERILFFDLADPNKRTDSQIFEALDIIGSFCSFGKVIISCNERELRKLGNILGIAPEAAIKELADRVRKHTGAFCIAVHMLRSSVAVTEQKFYKAPGYYMEKPKITTGGGDHFNAGFCYGILQKWTVEEALFLGNIMAGTYVRSGRSPDRAELIQILEEYV